MSLTNSEDQMEIGKIKVRTCHYVDNRGSLTYRRELIPMKPKSTYNLLMDDAQHTDPKMVLDKITNLHEAPDGIYDIKTVNLIRCWETGYVEDYDYKLVPVEHG